MTQQVRNERDGGLVGAGFGSLNFGVAFDWYDAM